MAPRTLRTLPLALLLAAACGSPSRSSQSPDAGGLAPDVPLAPQALPWTAAFLESALLVASEVRIEGPPGLIAHFVGRVEEGVASEVKTVPEGLRQTFTVEGRAAVEIRAQLDQLRIVAERRLVVLERPGPVDVLIEARGDVYHRDPQGREVRSPSLRLVGPVPR